MPPIQLQPIDDALPKRDESKRVVVMFDRIILPSLTRFRRNYSYGDQHCLD